MSYGNTTFWPALFSSANQEWATPPEIFLPLNHEFGFTLDVCALAHNAKVKTFFTPEQDGLSQPWGKETCWMNPPYGDKILYWMRKARDEATKGAQVICLVPSRTDTKWWHECAMKASEIRFIRGRIVFQGADSSAPFPTAIVIFNSGQQSQLQIKSWPEANR